MKIGIITLPLNVNYGGILQAYAVQNILKKQGHEVITIDRDSKEMLPPAIKFLSLVKRLILKLIFQKDVVVRAYPNKNEREKLAVNTNRFISENITSFYLKTGNDYGTLAKQGFDAFVVGSDQVWRPKYSPKISDHYLGFLGANNSALRIAYAVSFGVDHWEYTKEETLSCSKLAAKFTAISVREESALQLCSDHLKVKADHVLDPTMLVDKEDYCKLVERDNLPDNKGKILTYILDNDERVSDLIKHVEQLLEKKSFSTMPKSAFKDVGSKNLSNCVYPPVTNWIKGFIDADFVLTDSFHGTVFSIIFNKNFFTVGNSNRGMSRFRSLLKLFDLENRLLTEKDILTEERLKETIDFNKVNTKLEAARKKSLVFLFDALNHKNN
jgi:hypothetical protein